MPVKIGAAVKRAQAMPPKKKPAAQTPAADEPAPAPAPAKRGRGGKARGEPEKEAEEPAPAPAKRGRGKAAAAAAEPEPEPAAAPTKKAAKKEPKKKAAASKPAAAAGEAAAPPPEPATTTTAQFRAEGPALLDFNVSVSVVGGSHAKEIGDILAYEEDDDVYGVELSSGHARVKRADLLPRYDVTVLELDGKPVIKKGTVDGWHAESERYEVALRDLQTPRAKLHPQHVLLPTGARARVHGLVNAAHHNGRLGRVTDYDDNAGRYTLEYINNEEEMLAYLKLKRANVRLV